MKGATSRERRWCSSHVNKGQAWVLWLEVRFTCVFRLVVNKPR